MISYDSIKICMADLLIRDVPDEILAVLDARAGRLGLSRSEYLRRLIAQDAGTPEVRVTVDDLSSFDEAFIDLLDPLVMAQAWL
jgi:plasmid stability protein